MRRPTINQDEANELAGLLRSYREARGLSMRQLAQQTGVGIATISDLESASILGPQPETLQRIAAALGIEVSELYVVAGWLKEYTAADRPADLPAVVPYLRATFKDLSELDLIAAERFIDHLVAQHAHPGPTNGEDEHPNHNH